MVAEVCSAYVMRAGEVLELFATEGLRPEAVHRTRLRVGEGLVGVIAATARPLALADAQAHPDFAYRPETGEEIYHSLMGVPILRGGRVLGVLVVQNRTLRHYTEDEIEVAADDRDDRRRAGRQRRAGQSAGDGAEPAAARRCRCGSTASGSMPGLAIGAGGAARAALVIRQVVAEDVAGRARAPAPTRSAAMQSAIDELVAASRGLGAGRASRHPRDLPHVRRRSRLARPHHRGGAQRPHRRGGGAEGARRDPHAA